MTPEEQLAELNRQIADLKRQLGDTSEFVPIQNLQDAQRLFVSMKREVDAIGDGLSFVAKSFRDSVAELSKQNSELSASKSALKSISNTAQKILTTRSLEGDISEKELKSLEKRAKLQFESLKVAIQSGRLQGDNLTEAKNALKSQEDFFKATQDIRREQAIINKDSGVKLFTGLEDITNAIPGLNKFTGAFKEASTAAKEQARFNQTAFGSTKGLTKEQIAQNKEVNKGLDKFKALRAEGKGISESLREAGVSANQVKVGALPVKSVTAFQAGFKALGPIIKGALGPLVIIKELVDAIKLVDKSSGDLAKNLGISYDQSLGMVSSMTDIANLSMDTFVTTEGLVKAQTQLSTALGTNAQLSSTLLVDFTKLTEQAGYSAEAATTLGKISLATGQTAKNITTEFLGQAKALNLSNNLALNEKQLLESVAKTSKGTLATFAAKPKELANAVFEAKRLGLEISQVEKIADGLLEIESSLTAEFEAEVITGKQLNLERARYFALTNDIAGVAKELGKQGITQASFAKSSRIEQEAVAAAMGMSRDELGQMLIEQQAISAIGVTDAKAAKEKFEMLKAQGGEAYAISKLGDETYARQLASQSVQERFNKTVAKLQDIFVSLAEPVLAIISPFADLVNTIMPALNLAIIPIKTVFEGISFVVANIVNGIKQLTGFLKENLDVASVLLGTYTTISAIKNRTLIATQTELAVETLKNARAKAGAVIQGVISTIKTKGLLTTIADAAMSAFSSIAKIPFVGPALGAAAAASAYMLGKSYMSKGDDILSPGEGSSGYGKRTLMGPEGAIALNNKDTVIAGTNLFPERGNDRNLQPSGTTNVTVTLSKNDIQAIASAVREGASQANINVSLDGNAVSNTLQTPMAMNTRGYSV
jgi:hypothetical protein